MLHSMLYFCNEILLGWVGTCKWQMVLVPGFPLPFMTVPVSVWWGSMCSGGKLAVVSSKILLKSVVSVVRYCCRSLFVVGKHRSQM